jgi:glycosyltransferase involved in cell wall biosynthesis
MDTALNYYNKIKLMRCCVIIPTYNNHKTLQRVIDGVLNYTNDIIIVNDGSTDTTPQILEHYSKLIIVHQPENKGKGIALQTGFRIAKQQGYEYAITIDSDGQHFPEDIPVFISCLESEGEALLIGSRNMQHETVPKKSSTGNKISNYWFWVETGIKLQDTQSGYRLYPLNKIPKKFFTNKFEFEIEIITRTAWNGVPVKNIPVQVLYDMNERVSHFRPFTDFSRISIMHTVLVTISLLYIKPRDFFRSFKKKSLKRFFLENVLESSDSDAKKAMSIALGVFVGIAPVWGLQTVTVLFFAYLFRLNKLIAFTFSNISVPPMIPIIVMASIKIGSLIVGQNNDLIKETSIADSIKNNIVPYLTGSMILASGMAFLFGATGYVILTGIKKNKKYKDA